MSENSSESSAGGRVSRRELLKKAGKVGAARLWPARSPAAGAALRPSGTSAQAVKTGGSIDLGAGVDPAHIAPFGGILTANHWANEFIYDSLLEWDPKLNIRPALAESYDVVNTKRIHWTLKKGVKFPNGKEVTAADVKYSFDRMLNPPLPGSISLAQVPGIDGPGALEVQAPMNLKTPDARVYGFLAWGRYSSIVPKGCTPDQRAPDASAPGRSCSATCPNDRIEYVRNPNFWKKGLPYLDSIQLKIITDEQSRVAALRAGCDRRRNGLGRQRPALRERREPDGPAGAQRRVPRAADHDQAGREQAVARQARPAGGQPRDQPRRTSSTRSTAASASTRATLRPATARGLSRTELKTKYEKYDVPEGEGADDGGGQSRAST